MNALCFTLKGQTAFFKKPEVNSYFYFTYGNIHKVALLGIFGAILGYGGYTQKYNESGRKKKLEKGFPEFYEKLTGLKVAIQPDTETGFIRKKVQTFNNSVGYASKEQGGNLIIKEQWMEDPSWKIWVLLDCSEAEKIAKSLQEKKCIYMPYLGKNDHYADICQVEIKEVEEAKNGTGRLSALFPKENGTLQISNDFFADEEDMTYKYEEKLPYQLDEYTNNYILKSFIYTDAGVAWEDQDVYREGSQNIMFY